MQAKTKQRLVGTVVLLAVAAISIPLFYNHPFPSHQEASVTAKPSGTVDYVYDLPLAGQVSQSEAKGPVREQPLGYSSTEELRSKASQTAAISAHLLHTTHPKIENSIPKQCVKTCNLRKISFPSQLTAPSVKSTSVVVHKQHLRNNTRDSSSNKVLLQSELMSVPQSWVVQVASFGEVENAKHLLKTLRSMGLNAFSKKSKNAQGLPIHRVFVGPYIKQAQADRLRLQLQNQIHLTGVVRKYTL